MESLMFEIVQKTYVYCYKEHKNVLCKLFRLNMHPQGLRGCLR